MSDSLVWWATHAPIIQLQIVEGILLLVAIILVRPRILKGEIMSRQYKHGHKTRGCKNCGRPVRRSGKGNFCGERCENQHYRSEARQNYKGRKWHRNRLFAQSNLCGICDMPIENAKEATIDHIIPLGRGGSDTIENMQLAHENCNQFKGDKYVDLPYTPGMVFVPEPKRQKLIQ